MADYVDLSYTSTDTGSTEESLYIGSGGPSFIPKAPSVGDKIREDFYKQNDILGNYSYRVYHTSLSPEAKEKAVEFIALATLHLESIMEAAPPLVPAPKKGPTEVDKIIKQAAEKVLLNNPGAFLTQIFKVTPV